MITANRLRARAAREAAPSHPATISYAEHSREIQELTKAYELRLAEAGPRSGGSKQLETENAKLAKANAQLTKEAEALRADLAARADRITELEGLLEAATAPEPAPPKAEGKPSKR